MKTLHKVFLVLAGLMALVVVVGVIGGLMNPDATRKKVEANASAREEARKNAIEASGTTGGSADEAYPQEQIQFHAMNKACLPRYDDGINEVQKSLAFNQCNADRREFARTHEVSGWVGEITMIKTDQGASYAKIAIEAEVDGFEIRYSTLPSEMSDSDSGTLIRPGSPLFDKIAQMKERTTVRFDGEFLQSPQRGISESSFTEKGSVHSPDFNFRFTDVRPYESGIEAAKVNEAKLLNSSVSSVSSVGATSQASTSSARNQPLSGVVGMYYLHGKTVLREAGFSPDMGAGMPHTVDSDPADCGNAGCSAPWVNKDGDKLCVGIRIDESQEESRWEIVNTQPGSCG